MRLCIAAFIFITTLSFAQQGNRILLSDYLSELSKKHSITFSYDPEMLAGLEVYANNPSDLKSALAYLDSVTAFRFTVADAENILVSPQKQGCNMIIRGKVSDKESIPLTDAIVQIKGQPAITQADKKGTFVLYAFYKKTDTLSISFTGYTTKKYPLSQVNTEPFISVKMEESIYLLESAVINAYLSKGIDYYKTGQSIWIKPKDLGLLPGETETDIYAILQALPGINSPTDKAGNLTLRGSDPDKVLITFDDIPIYHKGHYFGTFSAFNISAIEKINVERNGILEADRGGRVSGSIDIRSHKKVPDSLSGSAGVASTYAFTNIAVPLAGKKLGLYLGARSSYPIAWNSPKINALNEFILQESEPGLAIKNENGYLLKSFNYAFNDLNGKLIFSPSLKHSFSLSALSIADQMKIQTYDTVRKADFYDTVRLDNSGLNFSAHNEWNKRFKTTTSVTRSAYQQYFSGLDKVAGPLGGSERYINGVKDFKVNNSLTCTFKKKGSLMAGYEINNIQTRSESRILRNPGPPVSSEIIKNEFVHSLFAGYNFTNDNSVFNFSAGIRSNYYTATQQFYFEPRASINIAAARHISLKASAGMYQQFVVQIIGVHESSVIGIESLHWQLADGEEIPVVTSRQAMAGAIYSFKELVIDIETYIKNIDHCTATNFLNKGSSDVFIYGGYQTYGADLLIKKKIKNFESWISYSYSQSQAKFSAVSFEYLWNQPHVLSINSSYKWKGFRFAAGWKYRAGLAALVGIRTPLIAGSINIPGYQQPQGPPVQFILLPNGAKPYKDRYPGNHQLNLAASYEYSPKSKQWYLTFGASIQNVYNNRIIYEQSPRPLLLQSPNTAILINKYGLGIMPSFQMTFGW